MIQYNGLIIMDYKTGQSTIKKTAVLVGPLNWSRDQYFLRDL